MNYQLLNDLESAAEKVCIGPVGEEDDDTEHVDTAFVLGCQLSDILCAGDVGKDDLPMIHAIISSNVARITGRAMRVIMVHMGLIK